MTDFLDLTDTVVIVTGGNNGIGLGMARGLARAGASVAIWGRNGERNEVAVEQLNALGKASCKAAAFACDVSNPTQVSEAMAATVDTFGRIDSLIANAGVGGTNGPFHEMTLEDFHNVAAVNVNGMVLSFQAAIRQMLAQGDGGSLVAMASLAGTEGAGGNIPYGATKGAVLAIMRGLATEYARYGIRTNAILPGWIETDMTSRMVDNETFNEKVIKRVPFRRWGKPEDFAAAAVYLAGPGSAFTNGQQFIIDGGYSVF